MPVMMYGTHSAGSPAGIWIDAPAMNRIIPIIPIAVFMLLLPFRPQYRAGVLSQCNARLMVRLSVQPVDGLCACVLPCIAAGIVLVHPPTPQGRVSLFKGENLDKDNVTIKVIIGYTSKNLHNSQIIYEPRPCGVGGYGSQVIKSIPAWRIYSQQDP